MSESAIRNQMGVLPNSPMKLPVVDIEVAASVPDSFDSRDRELVAMSVFLFFDGWLCNGALLPSPLLVCSRCARVGLDLPVDQGGPRPGCLRLVLGFWRRRGHD
jgi:hypothetical protein